VTAYQRFRDRALTGWRPWMIVAVIAVIALLSWRAYRIMKPWELPDDAALKYAQEIR
jgi:hypothetical protein